MDCWLLSNNSFEDVDYDELKLRNEVEWDLSVNNSKKKGSFEFVEYSYIKPALNGFGRCIHFTSSGKNYRLGGDDPYINYKNNKFVAMWEGEMH